jgi:tetratricopeptide (TPR) repeat protein
LAVAQSLAASQFAAALQAVEADSGSPEQKAEMLMEIAMGLQQRPRSIEALEHAERLYRKALVLCPAEAPLLRARITIRLGTLLQALPEGGDDALQEARDHYETALVTLSQDGTPQELAELAMNLGLVQQSLAPSGRARLHDAIQCYHRALRTFTREAYPQEYAILHNNLAIAYLAIPLTDERGRLREALAVQSFEAVLEVINLIEHPTEYAMIQNNLGNALQYVASGHSMENNLRALDAYDEALKVRNARDTPLEYAHTIANKANVLRNLPDDPDSPGSGRDASLHRALVLYGEALSIFAKLDAAQNADVVGEALRAVEQELASHVPPRRNGNGDARTLV